MISVQLTQVLKLFTDPKYYAHTATASEINQFINNISNHKKSLSNKETYQLLCMLSATEEAIENALTHKHQKPEQQALRELLVEIEQLSKLLSPEFNTIH